MPPTILVAPIARYAGDADDPRGRAESFLAPGQRYRTQDHGEVYTVSQLRLDGLGLLHVTLRSGRGRELSAFAEQVETAISLGDLLPLVPEESLHSC